MEIIVSRRHAPSCALIFLLGEYRRRPVLDVACEPRAIGCAAPSSDPRAINRLGCGGLVVGVAEMFNSRRGLREGRSTWSHNQNDKRKITHHKTTSLRRATTKNTVAASWMILEQLMQNIYGSDPQREDSKNKKMRDRQPWHNKSKETNSVSCVLSVPDTISLSTRKNTIAVSWMTLEQLNAQIAFCTGPRMKHLDLSRPGPEWNRKTVSEYIFFF
jgi:hypothetical protein